jgi:ACR3 family arsenite transporter
MNTIEHQAIVDEKHHRESNEDAETGTRRDLEAAPTGTYIDIDLACDERLLISSIDQADAPPDLPPLKGLSFLDRFLVLWILIAMGVGIALGNTVESVGPALQKGEFVGVSIPIGTLTLFPSSRFLF